MTFESEMAARRILRIQELLRKERLKIYEIAAGIHMSVRWTNAYIRYLRNANQIYIAEWTREARQRQIHIPLYTWGLGTDAAKPEALSAKQREQRRRDAIKLDKDRYDLELARRRAKRWKPKRDWTSSWIPAKPSFAQESA